MNLFSHFFYSQSHRLVLVSITASFIACILLVFYRFIYPKKKISLFFLLVIIAIIPILSIFRNGTYESGDLTVHTAYLIYFYENLKQGILFPQWGGDYCGGYGCPIFLLLYPLPYYLGALFHTLGFSFLNSTKLVLALSFIASGSAMYVFIKDSYGKVAGFVAAIFYLFVPYHLEDLHFRVGLGETLSYVFIPLVFLFSKKLIEKPSQFSVVLAGTAMALLMLSHSSASAIIIPSTFLYSLIVWLYKNNKKIKDLVFLFLACLIGLSLPAYYWITALMEVKYTGHIFVSSASGGFRSIAEYLFSPTAWGFLFQGNQGELRLIIGYPHLFVVALALFLIFTKRFKRFDKQFALLLFFVLLFLTLFLLLLPFTKPLWTIPILRTFQFVWRLLLPIGFVTSVIAGIVASKITKRPLLIVLCLFTIFSSILNWGNRKMVPEDPASYPRQSATYSQFYDPKNPLFLKNERKYIPQIPQLVLNRPKTPLQIIQGKAIYKQLIKKITEHEYIISARTDVFIRDNTHYFPGWKVYANGREIPIIYDNPQNIGIITFRLKKGLYKITVRFENTPVRKIGNAISFTAFLFIVCMLLSSLIVKRFR